MKTIQTFTLLILLFAAQTYCQEDIALENDGGSIAVAETGVPEDLIAILNNDPERVELDLETIISPEEKPTQVPENPTKKEEETPVTVPKLQESSSTASESEPSTESPEKISQAVNEESSLIKSEIPKVTVGASETDSSNLLTQEQSTEGALETDSSNSPTQEQSTQDPDSLKIEEETPSIVPEIQESSSIASELEPSTENPKEKLQTVDEGTPLTESGAEAQVVSEKVPEEQQPLETIVCVCDCGIGSDLPQKCEENSTEPAILENENTSAIELTSDLPSVEETSSNASETSSSLVNEESTKPVEAVQEPVTPKETNPAESTASNSLPEKEAEPTTEAAETLTTTTSSASTDSAPELNVETTSNLPNASIEPAESNSNVSSEPKPTVTDSPLEVSSTTISPCTKAGDISDPNNCRQYISCSGNATNLVSQELQCPERSAFNPLVRRCTRDLSPCLDEEPICLRAGSIANPSGENSSYFWCVPSLLGGYHKYHIQCAENEVYKALLGRCWIETLPQLGLGYGLINREPNDRDIVRAELKLLKKEIKLKAKEEKLKRKLEEKAKARAEKLAAKELKKQKGLLRKVEDDDDDEEEDDD